MCALRGAVAVAAREVQAARFRTLCCDAEADEVKRAAVARSRPKGPRDVEARQTMLAIELRRTPP